MYKVYAERWAILAYAPHLCYTVGGKRGRSVEAKFRCDSAYTKKLVQEFYEYCCFRRPRYIVYHIIFVLALAVWLFARLSGGSISYFIPIAVLVYYGMMLCYYYASVSLFMKRSRKLTRSGVMQMKMAAYPDRMEFFNGSGEPVELPYDEVKSVFCTKNLIAVRSKASLVYMLQKSGFTLGAADGFLDFMHEKGLYKKR